MEVVGMASEAEAPQHGRRRLVWQRRRRHDMGRGARHGIEGEGAAWDQAGDVAWIGMRGDVGASWGRVSGRRG
jgi:hypothetical protein